MKRLVLIAMVILGAAAAFAKSKPPKHAPAPTPPPVVTASANVIRQHDGWRADLVLDGPILGWALRRGHGTARELYLLVGPRQESGSESTPCKTIDGADPDAADARLLRWRATDPERLESIGAGLPEGGLRAVDLDGDGEDELLLVHAGGISNLKVSAGAPLERQLLLADGTLGKRSAGVALSRLPSMDSALRLATLGGFRTYRAGSTRPAALVSDIAVPERVRPYANRYTVQSPRVSPIGRTSAGRIVFATEPEALGKQRLRTLLLDPDGPAETRSIESWALLPTPERVVDRAFALLNGSPVLIVVTTSADKLRLLAEKALRIYPLAGDRTRAGDAPLYATTTGLNLWQEANVTVMDLDRDGHDDLVIAYWKGLKNAIAALEIYRGLPAGGFAKPRTQSFDVRDGDKALIAFGPDLDGDGRPDLVLRGGKDLMVFPGVPPGDALERPVKTVPSRTLALPEDFQQRSGGEVTMGLEGIEFIHLGNAWDTPVFDDLDGDGFADAVFADEVGGGTRIILALFSHSSSSVPSSTLRGSAGR